VGSLLLGFVCYTPSSFPLYRSIDKLGSPLPHIDSLASKDLFDCCTMHLLDVNVQEEVFLAHASAMHPDVCSSSWYLRFVLIFLFSRKIFQDTPRKWIDAPWQWLSWWFQCALAALSMGHLNNQPVQKLQ